MKDDEILALQKLLHKAMEEEDRCPSCGSQDFYLIYAGEVAFVCQNCDEEWGFADDDEDDDDVEEIDDEEYDDEEPPPDEDKERDA